MSEIPVIPTDSFEAFRDLLAILARPPKTTRLLNELERRMSDVKAGEAKLTADREAFEQASSKTRAELEERERKVRQRDVDAHDRVLRLAADQEQVEKARADLRSRGQEHFFGGMTREPDRGDKPLTDAHFGK
jgi:hypothetical protein